MLLQIHKIHQSLHTSQQPTFVWIPSHRNIPGNIAADQQANFATTCPDITDCALSISDTFSFIRGKISKVVQAQWDTSTTQLHTIHPKLKPLKIIDQNTRIRERLICRLIMGHTLITHGYLFNRPPPLFNRAPPPTCHNCQTRVTVQHLLLDCPLHLPERIPIIRYCTTNQIPLTLSSLLSSDNPSLHDLIFAFLSQTGLSRSM